MKTSYGACSEHTLQAWIVYVCISVYKVAQNSQEPLLQGVIVLY